MRGLSRSHVLFAAWRMAATTLGRKRDNSKIHPRRDLFVCVLFKKVVFLLSLAEQLLQRLISCRAHNQFSAAASLTHVCG